MDERFKPIFKVNYSLVRDENGNQNLYCKTSDNVSVISEHYLGNIKDIVGYIEENKQLKQQQKKFIDFLLEKIQRWENEEIMWEEMGIMKFGGEANTKKIYNDILEKYKEIIGSDK